MSSSDKVHSSNRKTYQRWELPNVVDEGKKNTVTASQIEELQKQAYDEGFAAGYEDGFDKGLSDRKDEINLCTANLARLMAALHEPFTELDDEVIAQMGELVILVARRLIRKELHTEPEQIVAVVREAINVLPVSSRNIRIYLHPEDAEILRDAFSMSDTTDDPGAWQLIDEPLIERGGCKVSSENSTIDATVEHRLNTIIASVLGAERADDNASA